MTDWMNDPNNENDTIRSGEKTTELEAFEQETSDERPVEVETVPNVEKTASPKPPVMYSPQRQAPQTPYTQVPRRAPSYSPNGAPNFRRPPEKKKSGSTVAIVLLSILCVLSLTFSCVTGGAAILSMVDPYESSNDIPSNDVQTETQDEPEVEAEDDRVPNENAPSLEISDAESFDDGGLSTSEIVARNLDATVVLTMYTKSAGGFYGYYPEESGSLTEAGGASGIIMTDDGYIITNSHCVYDEEMGQEYDRIDVTLYDGRVFEGATIVGYDPTTDLAVIKIDATNLQAAEFGDSSKLALGDRVVTLGNSGGLAWTVSQGVLSGQARDVYEDTGYAIKCLQVDAIINPGSSGGPLFNAYGQVVGVNSAKIVMTGYEGLGFSIPINEAKEVIDDLIKYGYVTGRVSLGIMGRTITSIGYEGFMIDSINSDSPLKGTKAQAGDIITHVDGARVMDYAELRTELTAHKVGETVTLTLLRLDRQTRTTQEITVTIKLKESR